MDQSLWNESIRLNEEWLKLLVRLEENLARLTPESIGVFLQKLQDLWLQAREADSALDAEIARGARLPEEIEQERIQLLRQIQAGQKALIPRLLCMKAVAAVELRQVRQGLQAMNGYGAPQYSKSPNRINRSG